MNKLFYFILSFIFINNALATAKHVDEIIERMNFTDQKSVLYNKDGSLAEDLNIQASITSYLNNIRTMVANFIQIAPDGTSSEGSFFLSRPGKLRWQYNPPVPILIIVNKDKLVYYDYELNEVTYSNTDEIIGSFLTSKNINFKDQNVLVDKASKKDGLIRLFINHKEKKQKLVLVFNEKPLELRKIEMTDENDQTTSVSFHDAKFNVDLDKNLFILKNPRIFKK